MERLGPYRILRSIAMGGMGEVHLAALERAGGFEKQVALKSILPRLMKDEKFVDLFEREARLAAVLSHRNIVQIFDFGRTPDSAWLAMEYIHGVDLRVVMVSGIELPVDLVVDIGINCARALDYAHRATDARGHPLHIIHRDVSPQNILLSYEGDIKLADFGLALASAHGRDEDDSLKGKFAYMSPEQATGRVLDERTDQFSLAVVLYELFSGRRAFHTDEGPAAVLRRVTGGNPLRPLKEIAPHLPDTIVQVIQRAMSPNRKDRFVDTGVFGEALRSAALEGRVELGKTSTGAWLKTHFPDSQQSHSLNTRNEATEVAAEPINIGRAAIKTIGLADTEVGLVEDLQSSLTSPEESIVSDMTPDEYAGRAVSEDDRTTISAWWLLPLAIGLAVSVSLMDWTGDDPSDSVPVARESGGLTGTVALGNDQEDVGPPVLRDQSVGSSASEELVDANAPPAQVAIETKPSVQPDAGLTEIRPKVPSTSDTKERLSQQKNRSKTRSSRRQRRPRKTLKKEDLARVHPDSENQKKTAKDDRTSVMVVTPKTPENASSPKPSKDPMTGDEKTGSSPSKTPQFPPGPRIRLLPKSDSFRVVSQDLGQGWSRLSAGGTLLHSRGQAGPNVKLRIVLKGGRFSVAVQTKPHVQITQNGQSQGFSPRANLPLSEGRHRFVFGDSKSGLKRLNFQLVE